MGIKAKLPNPIYEVDASKGGYTTSSILSFKEDVHLSKPFYPVTQSNFTRGSVATRVKNNGELQTVSNNIPRLDYTDGSGAWLLETTTENLQYYSENPSLWSQVNSIDNIEDNYGIAPNGTQTAALIESNSSWTCRGQIFGNFESGSQYTISLYVKALYSGSRNNFLFSTGFGNGPVIEATTEWQRYSYTFTPNLNVSYVSGILRDNSSPEVSILIWGMQTEKSSFATTYVPNLGTNRTARNLDAPTFIPPSLNPNKFSWVINDMKVNNSEGTDDAYFNLRSSTGLELYQRTIAGNWRFYDQHNSTGTPNIITFETGSTYDFVHNISGSIQIESYANGEYRTTYAASSEWDSIDRFTYIPTIVGSRPSNVQFSRMAFYNELLNEAQSKQAMSPNTDYVDLAIQRALTDGAEIILTKKQIEEQLPNNWDEASFLYIPFARKAGKSYSLIGPDLTIDRNSTATEVNSNLLLSSVSNNVPRIEFDANGPKGHLVELQKTNELSYSNDFTKWDVKVGATINNNVALSPDGTMNASRVNFTANTLSRFEENVGTYSVGDVRCFSIWIKADGDYDPFFLFVGGAFNMSELVTPTDEWQRVYVSGTANGTFTTYPQIRNNIAKARSLLIWQADFIEGLIPTSPIITNGASATRLVERATTPTIQKIKSGILHLKLYNDKHAAQYILSSASNTYAVFLEASVVYVKALTPNVVFFSNVINWGNYEGDINMIVKFNNGEVKLFVNGVMYTPSSNTFTNGSEFGFDRFGDSSVNNRDANAVYKKIALLPVLPSDEQCLQLSQL